VRQSLNYGNKMLRWTVNSKFNRTSFDPYFYHIKFIAVVVFVVSDRYTVKTFSQHYSGAATRQFPWLLERDSTVPQQSATLSKIGQKSSSVKKTSHFRQLSYISYGIVESIPTHLMSCFEHFRAFTDHVSIHTPAYCFVFVVRSASKITSQVIETKHLTL